MGGHATMVGEATTDVFFEAAFFDPERGAGQGARARAHERRGVSLRARRRFRRHARRRSSAPPRSRSRSAAARPGPVTEAIGELPRSATRSRVRPARVRALLGYEVADAEMRAHPRAPRRAPSRAQGDAMRVTPPTLALRPRDRGGLRRGGRAHPRLRARAGDRRRARACRCCAPREGARDRFDLRHAARRAGLPGGHQLQLRGRGVGARFRRQREARAPRQPDREPHERDAHDASLGGLVADAALRT